MRSSPRKIRTTILKMKVKKKVDRYALASFMYSFPRFNVTATRQPYEEEEQPTRFSTHEVLEREFR